MATDTTKKRSIGYLNKTFTDFKNDLIKHLEVYFPDDVQDFNESSAGLMLTELMAFIGDNMSFYLDKKFNESFMETAHERKNLFKHAKQLGFKPFGKTAAKGNVDAYISVPVTTDNNNLIIPDNRYAGIITKGAKLKSDTGQTYETLLDIDFSVVLTGTLNPNESSNIAVGDVDANGQPTTFILRSVDNPIIAGETKSTTFTITGYEAFKKLTINEDDVMEVLSIKDSEGNSWYEVEYLCQDTIFDGVENTSADATDVPYVLKLKSVPYRFITEYDIDSNRMSIIFGSGDAQNFDGELIPDIGDLSLPLYGKDTFTDFSLDPQNYLKTRTLGLAPVNTTLTVTYRVGGGISTNSGTGLIATVSDSTFSVSNTSLDAGTVRDTHASFEVLNPRPVRGGKEVMDIEELKHLIPAIYSSQKRAVTASDFIARALSMPSRYGSVFRAAAKLNKHNSLAVELVVLSQNSLGYVTVPPLDLKKNLKKYLNRFRMMTDGIEILDGEIIDIGFEFNVLVNENYNKTEVLTMCIELLKEHFQINKWQINQPVNITTIYSLIAGVPGVLSLIGIKIKNKVGTFEGRSYSATAYSIKDNFKDNILYCKPNAIFQIKYPDKDIVGTAR